MTVDEFRLTLADKTALEHLSSELAALWHEAKGDWNKAHIIVQNIPGRDAAWVHAYLHRKEPDEWNASYWYSRAQKIKPTVSHDDEWEQIVKSLLLSSCSL